MFFCNPFMLLCKQGFLWYNVRFYLSVTFVLKSNYWLWMLWTFIVWYHSLLDISVIYNNMNKYYIEFIIYYESSWYVEYWIIIVLIVDVWEIYGFLCHIDGTFRILIIHPSTILWYMKTWNSIFCFWKDQYT